MSKRITTKEQEELVLKNQALVHYIVKKYDVNFIDSNYEDLVSIGTIGLIKAAITFDKNKHVKFSTYAGRCINNEILMHFRKEKPHSNDISFEKPIKQYQGNKEQVLADIIINPNDFIEESMEKLYFIEVINVVLNCLTSTERLIMLYQIAGIKQSTMSQILNISQSYISRFSKKINNKVATYIKIKKQYKEVYSMSIIENSYVIVFSTSDIKNFNEIFARFLQNLTLNKNLPNFKINTDNKRIIVQVPAYPESLFIIAQIIKEIDEFDMVFVSSKK